MNFKRATGRRTGWGKRLALLMPATGLAAAAAIVTAFPGQASGSTASAVAAHCPTSNLRIDFGQPTATRTAYQHRVQITLVNEGHSTCSTAGFPGLNLVGDGGHLSLPVARAAQRYSIITLKRGQHVSFSLTYLLETPREIQGELGAWGPDSVIITAPGSVSHQSLAWRDGPVYWESIKSGRGTYLSAVGR